MPSIRIAQAQINPTVGDLSGNIQLIKETMARANGHGADLVTFPELAVCGYPPEDLLIKPRFLADCRDVMARLIPASRGITAIVGFVDSENGEAYNAAAVMHHGELMAVYRKVELPNYGVFDEKRYFTPGSGCLIVGLLGARIQVTICEDVWVPGSLAEVGCQESEAGLVINLSASPFHAGKLLERRESLAGFAARGRCLVCCTNLVGGQDELVFDGGSLVIGPRGRLLAGARRFGPDLLVTDLDLPPAASQPTPQVPIQFLNLNNTPAKAHPGGPSPTAPEMGLVEEIHAALVLGVRDYVRKNGFAKVVLGLSGGIDSALTAAVAVEALGAENVVGVTMPSRFTSGETLSDAQTLAQNLGIQLITVPIKETYDAYLSGLPQAFDQKGMGVTAENLQARIRGNILMALSNRHSWLVLTTGNKSETAVGYCTLYGDMAGGFAVIKDVPKTLVYQVADYVNLCAGKALIPRSTIMRPPTAELRPDQKDSDSLPPYEVLDPILKAYVEDDMVLDEIVALGHDHEVVQRVVRLVDLNEYKRRQAPPGIKITPKAFGKDRRLPITNHYRPGWPS